jgi:hypothetical protein
MEKVVNYTKNISFILKSLEINQTEIFPINKFSTIYSTMNRIKLENDKTFTGTKIENELHVTRTK